MNSAVTQQRKARVGDLVRVNGAELTRLRVARGLSQETLAARASVSLSTLWRAEAGHEVSTKSLHHVAGALQVPASDLVQRRSTP